MSGRAEGYGLMVAGFAVIIAGLVSLAFVAFGIPGIGKLLGFAPMQSGWVSLAIAGVGAVLFAYGAYCNLPAEARRPYRSR